MKAPCYLWSKTVDIALMHIFLILPFDAFQINLMPPFYGVEFFQSILKIIAYTLYGLLQHVRYPVLEFAEFVDILLTGVPEIH